MSRGASSFQIFTLGPEGTFSDRATQDLRIANSKILYTETFMEALLEASSNPHSFAVVPIENSVAGIIAPVQDALISEHIVIIEEIDISVRYALMGNAAPELITSCYMHPQASEQSSNFVARCLPRACSVFTHSNVDSGVRFLKDVRTEDAVGAIVPLSFAEAYPAWKQRVDVQDYKSNTTRFVLVRKRMEIEEFDFSKEKASLFVEFEEDHSGMLCEMLQIFEGFKINLCRLESRPSKHIPWTYVFYVDFYNTPQTSKCLKELRSSSFKCEVIGSYDSSEDAS